MKRLLSIVLAITLSLGLLPFAAFAAVDPKDEKFQSFLAEIGMTEEAFITYLSDLHESTLEDFEDFEDLRYYLGDLLTEENLPELLVEFDITEEEFNQLLDKNEASLDQYVFYDDLYYDLSDWLFTEELTPIDDENLQALLEEFGFETVDQLEAFLNKYDDSIENYEYIEDLQYAVAEHYFMNAKDELINTLDAFGLSLAEANKLANHTISLIENPDFDGEEFLTKMEDISSRLMDFPDFDSASDLSAEQIAEFITIWNELLNLLDLKVEYFLTKDGQVTPVSFGALMKMDSVKGSDLLIKIFAGDGELLADMLITSEMFGSDFVEETGKNLEDTKDAAEEVTKAVEKAPAAKAPVKTVKGGKLPNTATVYLQNTMAGLAFILLGAFVFRKATARRA